VAAALVMRGARFAVCAIALDAISAIAHTTAPSMSAPERARFINFPSLALGTGLQPSRAIRSAPQQISAG
jgi:hypothetical protein